MSDATILIRAALDAGVHLKFEDGKIKGLRAHGRCEPRGTAPAPPQAELLKALAPPEPPANPAAWKLNFLMPLPPPSLRAVCIAAGRGARYGMRCGVAVLCGRHAAHRRGQSHEE